MRKVILTLFMLIAIASCKNETEHKSETTTKQEKNMTKDAEMTLIGKTLEYNYGKAIYHVTFNTAKNLHWKCIAGDEKGKEADETYVEQRLNGHTFFISWVEADGLGVSQVVNLKDLKVNCYLKIEKDIIPLSGTIAVK